jgi:hypothetical protein
MIFSMKSTEQLRTESLFGDPERVKKIRNALVAVALTAAVAAGVVGLTGCDGQPNRVDPTIEAVVLGPHTKIRANPDVENGVENNIIGSVDATTVVKAKEFVSHPDPINGEWVELKVDDIKKVAPNFSTKTDTGVPVIDSDGTVWVNQQGAPIVRKGPSSPAKQ